MPESHCQSELALLALGSNLNSIAGDRAATLCSAIASLRATPGIDVEAVSEFIETDAVGLGDAPPFLNAAARVRSTLSPRPLLETCLAIEHAHGRDRARSESQSRLSRTLDIDLLLFGEQVINEPGLRVPHPRLHERLFVLRPASEVGACMRHPLLHATVAELLAACERRGGAPRP